MLGEGLKVSQVSHDAQVGLLDNQTSNLQFIFTCMKEMLFRFFKCVYFDLFLFYLMFKLRSMSRTFNHCSSHIRPCNLFVLIRLGGNMFDLFICIYLLWGSLLLLGKGESVLTHSCPLNCDRIKQSNLNFIVLTISFKHNGNIAQCHNLSFTLKVSKCSLI